MNGKYLTTDEINEIIKSYILVNDSIDYSNCRIKKELISYIIANGTKDSPVKCNEIYTVLLDKGLIDKESVSQNQICGLVTTTKKKLNKFISGRPGGFYFRDDIYYKEREMILDFLKTALCPE